MNNMLKQKEKNLLFILSVVSIALSLSVCVPFGKDGVSTFEIIYKFIAVPVVVLVCMLINSSFKYRAFRPTYRFATVTSYLPIFSYCVAILCSTILVMVRSNQVYSPNQWIGLISLLVALVVVLTVVTHYFYRSVISFEKKDMMLVDGALVVLMVVDTIFLSSITIKFAELDVAFNNGSLWFIVLPIVVGLLVGVLHSFKLYNMMQGDDEFKTINKKHLIDKWMTTREVEYAKAEALILNSLYDFTKGELQIEEAVVAETFEPSSEVDVEEVASEAANYQELYEKQLKLAELEEKLANTQIQVAQIQQMNEQIAQARLAFAAEKVEFEKEKAEFTQSVANERIISERIAQEQIVEQTQISQLSEERQKIEAEKRLLEQAKEQIIAEREQLESERFAKEAQEEALQLSVEAAISEKPQKQKKKIKPSYEKIVGYIESFEDKGIRVNANAAGTLHKFFIGKKLVLMTQSTNHDYRITFMTNKEDAINLIVDYPGVVVKAKTPKGPEWFKLTNKGDQEERFMKSLIKKSIKTLETIEAAELAAKEAEKARKAAEKTAQKEAEKVRKAAERAAQKAEQKAA